MSNYITYIDQVGRNILAKESPKQESGKLQVINPVMISVQPNNGQLQIQLIPLFFAEFVKYDNTKKRNYEFSYDLKSVAMGVGFDVDEKIISQYERIITGTFDITVQSQETSEPKVIKLFEE